MIGTRGASHRVELLRSAGGEVRLRIHEGETILEGAERQGVLLPSGCRKGFCATCAARALEGRLAYLRPPRALKARHRADGYVLLCIAAPRTDCRLRVGPDVVAELASNPFGGAGRT